MCQGKEKLNYFIKDYEKRKDTLTKKEQDTVKDMRIVQEMYARGFTFLPLDVYFRRLNENDTVFYTPTTGAANINTFHAGVKD